MVLKSGNGIVSQIVYYTREINKKMILNILLFVTVIYLY